MSSCDRVKSPDVSNDLEIGEQILKSCQKWTEHAMESSSHYELFGNIRTTQEMVENQGNIPEGSPVKFHRSSSFKYPQKPIERYILLEKETEIERTEQKMRVERKRSKPSEEIFHEQKEFFRERIDYQRILCKDDYSAGVRKHKYTSFNIREGSGRRKGGS